MTTPTHTAVTINATEQVFSSFDDAVSYASALISDEKKPWTISPQGLHSYSTVYKGTGRKSLVDFGKYSALETLPIPRAAVDRIIGDPSLYEPNHISFLRFIARHSRNPKFLQDEYKLTTAYMRYLGFHNPGGKTLEEMDIIGDRICNGELVY